MRTALSAWTPNVPWARFGCPATVDQNGGGTSSATPQIAAAAALWLHAHRQALTGHNGWQRVEAARDALFRAATSRGGASDEHLGRGILRADRALALTPAPVASLQRESEDGNSFAILRLLTGIGVAAAPPQRMLELEALQISQRSRAVSDALGGRDPSDGRLAGQAGQAVLAAVAEDEHCSQALREVIRQGLGRTAVPGGGPTAAAASAPPPPPRIRAKGLGAAVSPTGEPLLLPPAHRRLRIFTYDPSFASRMESRSVAIATVEVDWEANLHPGPVGEYLEVVDVDPSSERAYAPIDLNRPEILAQDGLEPSDGSPQFHQQMAYAVVMRTIQHFRDALGRTPFWADHMVTLADGRPDRGFVRRLRVYPHALREPNAYYSPEKGALLFGYFRATAPGTSDVRRGGTVFTCLSHDVVAHEATHALLDGLHPRWKRPNQCGRAGIPRSLRRPGGAVPAFHRPHRPVRRNPSFARGIARRRRGGRAGPTVRRGDRRAWRLAQRHRPQAQPG